MENFQFDRNAGFRVMNLQDHSTGMLKNSRYFCLFCVCKVQSIFPMSYSKVFCTIKYEVGKFTSLWSETFFLCIMISWAVKDTDPCITSLGVEREVGETEARGDGQVPYKKKWKPRRPIHLSIFYLLPSIGSLRPTEPCYISDKSYSWSFLVVIVLWLVLSPSFNVWSLNDSMITFWKLAFRRLHTFENSHWLFY